MDGGGGRYPLTLAVPVVSSTSGGKGWGLGGGDGGEGGSCWGRGSGSAEHCGGSGRIRP